MAAGEGGGAGRTRGEAALAALAAPLAWLGARARAALAIGVLLATVLPDLSALLRPVFPFFVMLLFCVSLLRLDLGALLARVLSPRHLLGLGAIILVLMGAVPVAVWAAGRAVGLGEAQLAALVYTFAAPPIISAAALCLILGLDAAFAIELTVLATLAAPIIGPPLAKALLGAAVPLDVLALTLRMAAIILVGGGLAVLLRRLLGPDTIARHGTSFDGVTTVVVVLFVVPLFEGFWGLVAARPGFALGTLALAFAANWGPQLLVVAARRCRGGARLGAAALAAGNRNASLYLAALPPDPLYGFYVACYQFPIMLTPMVLGRMLSGKARESG